MARPKIYVKTSQVMKYSTMPDDAADSYSPPELRRYGTVEDLTEGQGGTTADANQGTSLT